MRDEICDLRLTFESETQAEQYFESAEFINNLKEKFGRELPAFFTFYINTEQKISIPEPTKQGIPMDWRLYAEIDPITPTDISNEKNVEKRRLLIMEYGVNNYLTNVRELGTDAYGTLIAATIEDELEQQFVKVKNGTPEPLENRAYLAERGMLTVDGHKIYYIPVPDEIRTAKEGIEWSWDVPAGSFSDNGWDVET